MSFRFNNVTLFLERGGVIYLARADGRHQLLNGIQAEEAVKLAIAFAGQRKDALRDISSVTAQKLVSLGVFVEDDGTVTGGRQYEPWLSKIAFALRWLGYAPGLMVLVACGVGLMHQTLIPALESKAALIAVIRSLDAAGVVSTLALLSASVIWHELGHAVACVAYTGGVGRVRVGIRSGVPAVMVDVSSQCLAGRVGRVCIWMAGPVFQFAVAAIFLHYGSGSSALQMAAFGALAMSAASLLPWPGADGQKVLSIFLGRDLRVSLNRSDGAPDVIYTGAIILLISVMIYGVAKAGFAVSPSAFPNFSDLTVGDLSLAILVGGTMFAALAAFVSVVHTALVSLTNSERGR